ncbi:MAG: hypothetical protein PHE83_09370 [Opitutaceae bacterium]|nr:hypothetical protein [Opitutaceae bacterium]
MSPLRAYITGALHIAEEAKAGRILPGAPRHEQLDVALLCIRFARIARRLGRPPSPYEKLQVMRRDLQPYELCPTKNPKR